LLLSDKLRLEGISVSPGTVRNPWLKEGMETKYKRLLRLEEEKNGQDVELPAEQIRLIEKANPSFRERKVESLYPGYLLSQDTFLVGTLKGSGRIYMQAVVDTGSFAFGKLCTSKLPETAVDVLYDCILPFYEALRPVDDPPLPGIIEVQRYRAPPHQGDPARDQWVRGAYQPDRPQRVLPGDLPGEVLRLGGRLQADLDKLLEHYNCERPHRGYRNMGRRPIETIEAGKLVREQRIIKEAA
jgi:hypothetical protein